MRVFIPVFAAFAGLAVAQFNLPPCATSCVSKLTSGAKLGDCELVDVTCICKSKTFLDTIACCLADNCSQEEQENSTSEALRFCRVAGGVTDLPTAVVCSTTSSTTSSAASSSTGTSTTSGASTTSSAMPSSISSAGSSAASAATTGATPTPTPNAAIQNVAGVGAGVLGAFAAVLL